VPRNASYASRLAKSRLPRLLDEPAEQVHGQPHRTRQGGFRVPDFTGKELLEGDIASERLVVNEENAAHAAAAVFAGMRVAAGHLGDRGE